MSGSDQHIFDAEFAISQFSGNQSLLQQILEKFIQQYQSFDRLLEEHLKQQDFNAAKQQIHTIKGVSGNLGMNVLHLACKKVEKDLAEQIFDQTLEAFLVIFRQTFTVVQSYLEENGTQESPTLTTQQDDKTALIGALKRGEFISESKMQSYTNSLNLSSEQLNQLKQAIDNLDYASAIALLK